MLRMNELDKVEKDVVSCLHTAGKALEEISKDKPSQKQVDLLVTQFMNSLQEIDSKLTENIKYLSQVSTGQPHEGSSYASQKVLQMAWHRLEHARSRVAELDRYVQCILYVHNKGTLTYYVIGIQGRANPATSHTYREANLK